MSIINKMHQELQDNSDNAPILASMPAKKRKQKVLVFALISLLLTISIGLSYLIYDKKNEVKDIAIVNVPEAPIVLELSPIVAVPVVAPPVKAKTVTVIIQEESIETVEKMKPTVVIVEQKAIVRKTVSLPVKTVTPSVKAPAKKIVSVPVKEKVPHLEIKTSTLSNTDLANIRLENAQKALAKGDTLLASQEKTRALNIKPDMHEVRKSLALYYYGIGEQGRATNVLKVGAVKFPEYSDFNLMLSRIALKEGDKQKAYLYLNRHPPKVEGNLDYHVSYAILAQKFKNYEQSEKLYNGLLSQRPNNGRWRMSLAIAQDRQGKQSLAIESYQKAVLQVDLSSKAKKYINQRLTYLANQ